MGCSGCGKRRSAFKQQIENVKKNVIASKEGEPKKRLSRQERIAIRTRRIAARNKRMAERNARIIAMRKLQEENKTLGQIQ